MSAQNENEIILEEESDDIPNMRPEQEKILPPTFYEKIGDNLTLDLQKLIQIVISRYKLLKDIEYFSRKKYGFYKIIKQKIPLDLTWENEETINNDIASHFLLALITCQNAQELRWFIQQETLLYYARIRIKKNRKQKYDMFKILSFLGLKLKLFDPNNPNQNVNIHKIMFRRKAHSNEKIYKVNFTEAIHLIPQRDFYLHKGYLYILENDLGILFFKYFQKKQYEIINKIKVNAEEIKRDKRIKEIIIAFTKEKEKYNLHQTAKITKELSNFYKLKKMEDIKKYYKTCFPLCMYIIVEHLNKYSHLMNLGRYEFTLFLKGTGLPVEEALKFYQRKFAQKCTLEKFEKQYAYYFKYFYGKEGKYPRNYMPMNCEKMISLNPPIGGECHGCPFKNYSSEKLRNLLSTCNLRDTDIEDILIQKKDKRYTACCVKYFQGKFIGSSGEGIGIHPNKYFSIAMKLCKGEDKNSQEKSVSNDKEIKNNIESNNIEDIQLNENKINNNIIDNNDKNIKLDDDININDFDIDDDNNINDSDSDDSDSNINDHKDINNDKNNNNSNANIKEDKKEESEEDDEENDLSIDIDNVNY